MSGGFLVCGDDPTCPDEAPVLDGDVQNVLDVYLLQTFPSFDPISFNRYIKYSKSLINIFKPTN
jgi:hypothetical protein